MGSEARVSSLFHLLFSRGFSRGDGIRGEVSRLPILQSRAVYFTTPLRYREQEKVLKNNPDTIETANALGDKVAQRPLDHAANLPGILLHEGHERPCATPIIQ